jgi:hypothetical protein
MNQISITIENNFYALRSPYDVNLVAKLKALIPAHHRAWNGEARAWLIDPAAIGKCLQAIERAGYERPSVPPMPTSQAVAASVQRVFTVEYVGQCKERDDKSITALGSVKGFWSVEFPESVLKSFFEDKQQHLIRTDFQTAYQKLCVIESATDNEIKKAYWRLARQWHPDTCSEPEAQEKFIELKEAYDLLASPQSRRKYDAGLYFEREAAKRNSDYQPRRRSRFANGNYRAPLRCGLITVEGTQRLSRFTVSKILDWQDIVRDDGAVMSTSWNKQLEKIEIRWI